MPFSLNLEEILINILVVTLSLSFHEYAHARVAFALGDDTAYLSGRMNLNPLSHLDPLGVLCFVVARIGWARPVPVNPARMRRAKSPKQGLVLTSLAGPVANLLLAVSACFLQRPLLSLLTQTGGMTLLALLSKILGVFFISNIYLAIFNLLPVPPLDGYKIMGALLPNRLYYQVMSYERYIGMAFLLLVYLGNGLISRLMHSLAVPIAYAIVLPIDFLFNLIPFFRI